MDITSYKEFDPSDQIYFACQLTEEPPSHAWLTITMPIHASEGTELLALVDTTLTLFLRSHRGWNVVDTKAVTRRIWKLETVSSLVIM